MTRRRSILRRFVLWVVATAFMLASYILGAPLVWFATWKYVPDLIPVVQVVYAPFNWYCSHPEFPGAESLNHYYTWAYNEARKKTQ